LIDIGSIAYGPELKRRPILRELERLSQILRKSPDPRASIELAFVVPGSLGQADFRGFEMARRRGGERTTIVFIEVPRDVAESPAPLSALLELARQGLVVAASSSRGKSNSTIAPDTDVLTDELQRASEALGVPPRSQAPPATDHAVEITSRTTRGPEEAGLEIEFEVPDSRAIDEAFELEQLLEDRLSAAQVGYVDGNEIGQGRFTIFTYGPRLDALREVVEPLVRERWRRAGVDLRLTDPAGEDVGSITI